MADTSPCFNRTEIGQLVLKLRSVCRSCKHHATCEVFTAECPVGHARNLMATYLEDGVQVRASLDTTRLPAKPPGVEMPDEIANELQRMISVLCGRCMFHADKCFLNIFWRHIDDMRKENKQKPMSSRPPSADK